MATEAEAPKAEEGMDEDKPKEGSDIIGSAAMRPVFLGNLNHNVISSDVEKMFSEPITDDGAAPVPVDRVDLKRGFCFVFLKDAENQDEKDRAEAYVSRINGMEVPNVSKSLRAEFARGDGRTKRKEDERRKNIQPSETLFVVNFHEETTKREDLQMLFEPFGELVRIDMKRNYAFVQYNTVEEAKKAKEQTNGGKLDSSIITVEYVARRAGERDGDRRRRDGRRGGGDRYGGGGDRGRRGGYDRHDDRRGGGGNDRYDDRRGGGRDRHDDRRRDYDDRDRRRERSRSRSPGYRRGRSRSRSRSPPRRHRSHSPSPGGRREERHDERRGGRDDRGYSDRGSDRGYDRRGYD